MSTTTQLMTADDLWRLPDDGMRHELVQGELQTMAPGGSEHGAINMDLAGLLWHFVRKHKLGRVFSSDTGFVLASNPDTVRAPDVAFVSAARLAAVGLPQKFWPGAPDLAIETISPSDTLQAVEEKVDEWLAAGTTLVWVLNPKRKRVTVYRAPRSVTILEAGDELDGQDVVPGFKCGVADVFP
jgi:Uma2 family endonuclease